MPKELLLSQLTESATKILTGINQFMEFLQSQSYLWEIRNHKFETEIMGNCLSFFMFF